MTITATSAQAMETGPRLGVPWVLRVSLAALMSIALLVPTLLEAALFLERFIFSTVSLYPVLEAIQTKFGTALFALAILITLTGAWQAWRGQEVGGLLQWRQVLLPTPQLALLCVALAVLVALLATRQPALVYQLALGSEPFFRLTTIGPSATLLLFAACVAGRRGPWATAAIVAPLFAVGLLADAISISLASVLVNLLIPTVTLAVAALALAFTTGPRSLALSAASLGLLAVAMPLIFVGLATPSEAFGLFAVWGAIIGGLIMLISKGAAFERRWAVVELGDAIASLIMLVFATRMMSFATASFLPQGSLAPSTVVVVLAVIISLVCLVLLPTYLGASLILATGVIGALQLALTSPHLAAAAILVTTAAIYLRVALQNGATKALAPNARGWLALAAVTTVLALMTGLGLMWAPGLEF